MGPLFGMQQDRPRLARGWQGTQEMTRKIDLIAGLVVLGALALATPALAQYSAPKMGSSSTSSGAPGENYHLEVAAGLWNPTVMGVIASEQFGIAGSKIDFVKDLKFQQTRFKDFRFVLKASKHNKLYAQYTPVSFSSDTTLTRDIVFNGQKFALNLPIKAGFDWKVWRIGYELDVVSLPRGFLGVTLEGRLTDFGASLKAPATSEFTRAKGPLPAVGAIARVYPVPQFSLTGSVSGFKVPDVSPDYAGNYIDWEAYGTLNVNRYVGVQGGFRKMSTTVTIKKDFGDMKYTGVWFGAVVRY